MELRLKSWQSELDELSENFKKLCQCRKKKGNEEVVAYFATNQLEFLKRVNSM